MKRFFIHSIALICIVSCGNSQEITKQATVEKDSVPIKKEASIPVVNNVPEADTTTTANKNETPVVKTKSPMRKYDNPAPQIMKVPKPEAAVLIEEKVEEKVEKRVIDTPLPEPKVQQPIAMVTHSAWNTLLKKHVSQEGVVHYKGFAKDKTAFKAYLKMLSTNLPQENWTVNQKLAYWMNAYNAFTVKLILDNYPLKSIKDIKKPWDLRFFQLGKKWYNLNEIEHQILRKMGDPRIHFGINCASFSCPPLLNKAFTPENVQETLKKLAVSFINDKKRNEISANSIRISKIFQWFGKDFKTKGSLIDFLNQYATTKINSGAKQHFMDYNWNLNE